MAKSNCAASNSKGGDGMAPGAAGKVWFAM
jgi:hypothetical protein